MTDFDPLEPYGDPEVMRAAACGAEFLRALPANVDPFQMLKLMGGYLGDEMATEILRYLMDPHRDAHNSTYRCRELGPVATGKKIQAIKEVRAHTGCGLKEAKDFVEGQAMKMDRGVVRGLNQDLYHIGFEAYPSR